MVFTVKASIDGQLSFRNWDFLLPLECLRLEIMDLAEDNSLAMFDLNNFLTSSLNLVPATM